MRDEEDDEMPMEVYAINRETFTGLGSGFIKYISIEGQRIVLKMGMVPATMPVRFVRTHSE